MLLRVCYLKCSVLPFTVLAYGVAYNNACRIMSLPKHCSASNMFVSRNINNVEGLVRKQQLPLKNRV